MPIRAEDYFEQHYSPLAAIERSMILSPLILNPGSDKIGGQHSDSLRATMPWTWGISPDEPIEVDEGTAGSLPGPVPTTEYATWLAASLANYERLARHLIKHRAEKGRIVESVVKSALRGILPGRFSIGTGFAITESGQTSSQLDLVIYDGLFNSPIILEGGTGLFPIECVYGFVEVKSLLNGDEIEQFRRGDV